MKFNFELHERQVPSSVSEELGRFEKEFTYPLGQGKDFTISHGSDYLSFLGAMGDAAIVIARDSSGICGNVGRALINVREPSGASILAVYIADLKISERAQGTGLVFKLLQKLYEDLKDKATHGISLVMQGTSKDPSHYSGRNGIPEFREVFCSKLFRVEVLEQLDSNNISTGFKLISRENFLDRVTSKSHKQYVVSLGKCEARSMMEPRYLVYESGTDFAMGVLEDTLKAKRLFDQTRNELISAHLSSFLYSNENAALNLIFKCLYNCRELNYPAMFFCVPPNFSAKLENSLTTCGLIYKTTSVKLFAYNFPSTQEWLINSSEI